MSNEQYTTDENVNVPVASAAQWKKARFHTIRLNSGAFVKIRIPDLPAMIEAGHIPQNLIEVAIGMASGEAMKPSVELVKQSREFTDLMTLAAVVEPKITEADLADIPYEDKQLIVEIATRQRDADAEGSNISGLDKSEKFRRFRLIGEFDPRLADFS